MTRPADQPSLSAGLATTFDALVKTHNEAAVDVLLSALDDPNPAIADGALTALLARRTVRGHHEIISRLPKMDQGQRDLVLANPRFLGRALRDAIQSADPGQCQLGCQTALWLKEYDLMPALVHEAEDNANPNRTLAASHALELAERLYQELAVQTRRDGRDPQLIRQHVVHSLERSLVRFAQHKRSEIVEAFLLLAPRDHALLRRVLADPMHEMFVTTIDLLTHSSRGGVVRLALSFLDDAQSPSAAISILGRRTDRKFLEHFLRKIGARPSSVITHNLRRIDTLAWLQQEPTILEPLDDDAQVGAVQMAVASGLHRSAAFKLIAYLTRHGKPCGRRAAVAALPSFRGQEANALASEAAGDPDPEVQALALAQLRTRGVPGALALLLAKLDSPYDVVRTAVRGSLDEFSFDRFQAAFDMLDDQVRRSTGAVVRKVDLHVVHRLQEELKARSRTRRLRGVAMTCAMKLVPELESPIIERLGDEDHLVRAEAAKALAESQSPRAKAALQSALNDRSIVVQDAAQWSLEQGGSFLVSESLANAILEAEARAQQQADDRDMEVGPTAERIA